MKQLGFAFLTVTFFLSAAACNQRKIPFKERNNTRLYYENLSDISLTDRILAYWISNDFEGKSRSDLKIEELEKKFQLHLIVNENFTKEEPGFEDIRQLNELQMALNTEIDDFKNKPCELVLSDNQFTIKHIPNPL